MAARKKKPTRRRRKAKISLINTAVSLGVVSAWTRATAGMGLAPFLTDGWVGPKSSASDNSWEVSLYEIMTTLTGMDTTEHGFGSSGKGLKLGESVQKNFKAHGGAAIAATILLPLGATLLTGFARKQINQVNRLAEPIMKPLGVKL